jgi:hypothetical protein
MNPTARQAAHHLFIVQFEIDDLVEGGHATQRVRLGDGAGEAVENEALLRVILAEAVLDEFDRERVRHEFTAVEYRLHLLPEIRSVLDVEPEDVSRRYVRDPRSLRQPDSHRAFSRSRGSQKYQFHCVASFESFCRVWSHLRCVHSGGQEIASPYAAAVVSAVPGGRWRS